MPTNIIRELVRNRIEALMVQQLQANHLRHGTMRGNLREQLLLDFFREVVPVRFSIVGGVVCDSAGGESLQLDFIVTDPTFLPSMALRGDASVVPVESAFMIAEIKSTIARDTIEQVKRQVESVRQLRFAHQGSASGLGQRVLPVIIPSVILGYDTRMNAEALAKEIQQENIPDLAAVCVIGRFTVLKTGTGTPEIVQAEDGAQGVSSYNETLAFVGRLYHALLEAVSQRPIQPNWYSYMYD